MKFNIKHLMAVSAVALAMIGAGGAINANNNNPHADSFNPFTDPTINKESEEEDKADGEAEHEADEQNEPYRKQLAKSEMTDGDLDPELAHDPTIHHYLVKHGYTNHQINKAKNVNLSNGNAYGGDNNEDNRLARKAIKSDEALAHSHNLDINKNYTKRHYRKGIKRYHHKRIAKRANRKLANHKAKRNRKIRRRGSKRTNKKLANSIKYDKRVLANKHARYFNSLIKRINSKHIRKSTKRALSKKINYKANRRYLNTYKDLVKDQRAIAIK